MTPGAFIYKGLNSKSFGVISKSIDRSLLPEMKSRLVEIYGKHGVIDFGQNNYGTRQIKMHIAYVGSDFLELRSKSREISSWLTSKQWEKLIFDDEPDRYYLARIYDAIGLDTLFRAGETDITFECQPFAFRQLSTAANPTWDEADFPWSTDLTWDMSAREAYIFNAIGPASFTFNHPGTQDVDMAAPQGSKFDLIIIGSWSTLGLALNGKLLSYDQSGSGTLVIDSVDMEVTLDGVNKLDALSGDIDSFLSVIPGSNTLSIIGADLNVSITIDFIPMWL